MAKLGYFRLEHSSVNRARSKAFPNRAYGDGYASMNMELMSLDVNGIRKNVYGTAFGMSGPNTEQAASRIRKALTVRDNGTMVATLNVENVPANQLLNDYWYKLSS